MELEPLLSEVRHSKMIKGAQAATGELGLAPAKCKKDTPAGEERASTLKEFENTELLESHIECASGCYSFEDRHDTEHS